MIPILRYYHESQGLLQVDDLKGYIFTSESFAHEFTVARLLYDPDTGQEIETPFAGVSVTARFRRADGVPVVLTGELVRGRAVVKLSPECYQVPGAFDFFIFVTTEGVAQCVYTARAAVMSSEGEGAVLAPSARKSIEEQIEEILSGLDADAKNASMVAAFARNIGDVEGAVATFQSSVDGIVRALAAANVRTLNGPNLLKQNFFTIDNGRNIIYGNAARYIGSGCAWVKSLKADTEYTFTEAPDASQWDSVYREIESVDPTTGAITYKDIWHCYKDEDQIRTALVDLGDANAIEDLDGETYRYAIAFTVNNGDTGHVYNAETLIYSFGNDGGTRADGSTYGPYGQLPMEDGETYTMACWARVTAGEKALLSFTYGQSGDGYVAEQEDNRNRKEVAGSGWQRVHWTFVYHATGANNAERKPRIGFGVTRWYDCTVQLAGFRLAHGGLFGSNTVDTLEAHLQDLAARVEALERQNTAGTQSTSGETE